MFYLIVLIVIGLCGIYCGIVGVVGLFLLFGMLFGFVVVLVFNVCGCVKVLCNMVVI